MLDLGVVDEVITIFKEDIEPPLTTHSDARAEYLQGITADMLVVLSLNNLFNDKRLIVYEGGMWTCEKTFTTDYNALLRCSQFRMFNVPRQRFNARCLAFERGLWTIGKHKNKSGLQVIIWAKGEQKIEFTQEN